MNGHSIVSPARGTVTRRGRASVRDLMRVFGIAASVVSFGGGQASPVLAAPEVSLLALLEVIFGIALAWLGAGEQPGPSVLVGGSLVIVALVGNELLGWRARR